MGTHDSVLAAIAQSYELRGHAAQQLWVGDLGEGTSAMFDVAIPDQHRLIDVETLDTIISLEPGHYEPWQLAGYEIWVVAPEPKTPTVRRRLRRRVDWVQGWRIEGPKVILDEPVHA